MNSKLTFHHIEPKSALVCESMHSALRILKESMPDSHILVAKIDPAYMGGHEFCEHYRIEPKRGGNCIVLEAITNSEKQFIAVVYPVNHKVNINNTVRKHLGAKKVSLAPLDEVLKITGMEYGSITPIGLPNSWKILFSEALLEQEKIIVGGGKKISKLLVPTELFRAMEQVEVVQSLSSPI